jgi:hypothetical protein
MIISHGRKYIFIHIPKTGGTSLSLALEAKAMKDDVLVGDTPKAKNRRKRVKDVETSGRLWKHSRVKDIYGLVNQKQIEEYFVFTIVRNPWDRMVSYYHWLKAQKFDHVAVHIANECDFTGFLAHPTIQISLQNDATLNYLSDNRGLDQCNMYLKMETLSRDAEHLGKSLGMKLAKIPHDNRSSRDSDYMGYYNAESKNIIGRFFADDIKKFDYSFEPKG